MSVRLGPHDHSMSGNTIVQGSDKDDRPTRYLLFHGFGFPAFIQELHSQLKSHLSGSGSSVAAASKAA